MRCRMCGKQLENGTLCDECYKLYIDSDAVSKVENANVESANSENTETINRNNVVYKLVKKYSPKYYIMVNWEWFFFSLIVILSSFFTLNVITILTTIFILCCLVGISMIIVKKFALAQKCVFYEDRVVYTFDFLFIHKKKILEYKEIDDITYSQTMLQKKFKMGDVNIFGKKNGIMFNGIIVKDIAKIEDVFKDLTQRIGEKLI